MIRCICGLLAVLLAACGTKSVPPAEVADPSSALIRTSQISGDFLMRQQIRYQFANESGSFEAVIQKRCDEVVVIGFTPFGARAFTISQRELEVRVDAALAVAWPVPPERILHDIHRVFFLPLPQTPPADGSHESTLGSALVRERWSSGRLVQRSLHDSSVESEALTVITYSDGARYEMPARKIRLENLEYGYVLDIDTVTFEQFSCAGDTSLEQR